MKPVNAAGYTPQMLELMRSTCLDIASVLGTQLMEDITVVGGLVPALILPKAPEGDDYGTHIGTSDVDIALSLALLDEQRYKAISTQLRRNGFEPDTNEAKKKTRHRWRFKNSDATVEFLIEPTKKAKAGKIQSLESDIAAVAMRGMHLAFRDVLDVPLEGVTLHGETGKYTIKVCGPGAFVVLKAFALVGRRDPKDAYDLFMVLRNYGDGPSSVAERLAPLREDPDVIAALEILASNFSKDTDAGPRRLAEFLSRDDGELKQDAVGLVADLLDAVGFPALPGDRAK